MDKDPAGIRVLQRHFKHLEALVPLETAASGLIVFTQDWRIQRKLDARRGSREHQVRAELQGQDTERRPPRPHRSAVRQPDPPPAR